MNAFPVTILPTAALLAASDTLLPVLILLIGVATLLGTAIVASGMFSHPRVRRLMLAARPSFRITSPGALWLLIAFLLFAVGWLKALNLVLLLAYLMAAMWCLNFFAAGRRLARLQARRRLAGPIFAQTLVRQEIEIANTARKEIVGVRIVDRGPDHGRNWLVARLGPGERTSVAEEIVRPRRCYYACEPIRAVSGYPFGLIQRSAIIGPGEDQVVLPRLGQVHRGRLRRFLGRAAPAAGWQMRTARPQPLVPTEFHGIRPYQHGDSPRWIHWRTSARRGELMVREFEETTSDNLLLVVDPWLPAESAESRSPSLGKPRPAERVLEDTVSLAASICWEWCRQKDDHFTLAIAGPAPVVCSGITGREHAERMLERLAVLRGSPDSFPDLLCDALLPARLPPGPVLVVGTRPSDLVAPLTFYLQRPVAEVNAEQLDGYDFYQRPADHAH
jgi:uncharacterized protein (DUF58 family)